MKGQSILARSFCSFLSYTCNIPLSQPLCEYLAKTFFFERERKFSRKRELRTKVLVVGAIYEIETNTGYTYFLKSSITRTKPIKISKSDRLLMQAEGKKFTCFKFKEKRKKMLLLIRCFWARTNQAELFRYSGEHLGSVLTPFCLHFPAYPFGLH